MISMIFFVCACKCQNLYQVLYHTDAVNSKKTKKKKNSVKNDRRASRVKKQIGMKCHVLGEKSNFKYM